MNRLEALPNLDVEIVVELGRVRIPIENILNLREGSHIETGTKHAQHDEEGIKARVDVRLNGERFAVGEVVTIGESYAVRVLELVEDGH
jgi:flagellar motor switch protein FliN/FliY